MPRLTRALPKYQHHHDIQLSLSFEELEAENDPQLPLGFGWEHSPSKMLQHLRRNRHDPMDRRYPRARSPQSPQQHPCRRHDQ